MRPIITLALLIFLSTAPPVGVAYAQSKAPAAQAQPEAPAAQAQFDAAAAHAEAPASQEAPTAEPAAPAAHAPSPPAYCAAPDSQSFDFWIGEWSLTWSEEGRGTNTIRRILGNCVIEENFAGDMPEGRYEGKSVSVYDADEHTWKQTWVDSDGVYLDFTGSYHDDRMVLAREASRNDTSFLQRMVWYNIHEDSLDWNWEKSTDGGTTWNVLWHIDYRRAN